MPKVFVVAPLFRSWGARHALLSAQHLSKHQIRPLHREYLYKPTVETMTNRWASARRTGPELHAAAYQAMPTPHELVHVPMNTGLDQPRCPREVGRMQPVPSRPAYVPNVPREHRLRPLSRSLAPCLA